VKLTGLNAKSGLNILWDKFLLVMKIAADNSGFEVWGMDCLRSLETWDRGFESHSRHGCLCAFIQCLYCSVCR
jgi:hypothetical protein